jgi:hypothetical protein
MKAPQLPQIGNALFGISPGHEGFVGMIAEEG